MICEKLSRKDSWFGRLSHSWNHFFSLFEEVIATNSKRSGPEIFLRKDVVKICIKFNFIEITLRHGCFPVNLLHIFRTVFLKNTSGWLLLNLVWNPVLHNHNVSKSTYGAHWASFSIKTNIVIFFSYEESH